MTAWFHHAMALLLFTYLSGEYPTTVRGFPKSVSSKSSLSFLDEISNHSELNLVASNIESQNCIDIWMIYMLIQRNYFDFLSKYQFGFIWLSCKLHKMFFLQNDFVRCLSFQATVLMELDDIKKSQWYFLFLYNIPILWMNIKGWLWIDLYKDFSL